MCLQPCTVRSQFYRTSAICSLLTPLRSNSGSVIKTTYWRCWTYEIRKPRFHCLSFYTCQYILCRCLSVTTTECAAVLDNHINRYVIDTFEHRRNETKRRGTVVFLSTKMANLRQTPLTCSGHTRPVVHLAFSDVTDCGYFLISACKGGLCS